MGKGIGLIAGVLTYAAISAGYLVSPDGPQRKLEDMLEKGAYSLHTACDDKGATFDMHLKKGNGSMASPYSLRLRRTSTGESNAEITYVKGGITYSITRVNNGRTVLSLSDPVGLASTEDPDINSAKAMLKFAKANIDSVPCNAKK